MTRATADPHLESWVPVSPDSDFPIQNLPYGLFSARGGPPRAGVAVGDHVLDLAVLQGAGLLAFPGLPDGAFREQTLNGFLALSRETHQAVRARLTDLLSAANTEVLDRGLSDQALLLRAEVTMHLPIRVGDYVDFYSSEHHAANLGRIFRPDGPPLLPNWRHLPVGYHGRSSTIVVSGTEITRPNGQLRHSRGADPVFGPSQRLDIELEVGFVTTAANPLGTSIPVDRAEEHIFGMCLVNDWSARDIQAWEYQPLGPFLGKSFATTVSPWIVTLDALSPYRVPPPPQDPAPLPYLRSSSLRAVDLHLEIELIPAGRTTGSVISRAEFKQMYWTMAQQLAHATSNGASVAPGDLFASGAVSGSEPDSFGSLLELTWNGENPLRFADGSTRSFLRDGDAVVIRGWCGGDDRPRIGFGECRGTIRPALR